MKLSFFLIVLFFMSCAETTKESDQVADSSSLELDSTKSMIEDEVEDISSTSELELEIHDFKSFKKYLNTTDDKTYVVNFWATWCKPCIKELPYFEELNKNFKDEDVEVILVSLDFPSKYDSHLKPYIIDNKLESKIVALDDADSNSWIPQVDLEWSGAIPATLIFNKTERTFYEGSFTYEELITAVKPFIE